MCSTQLCRGGFKKRVNEIIFNDQNKTIVCMKTAERPWNKQNGMNELLLSVVCFIVYFTASCDQRVLSLNKQL